MRVGEEIPQALRDAQVFSEGGESVVLGSLLKKGEPTLLVFLRHFGCIGCSMNLGDLAPRLFELENLGVSVVLIGNGSVEHLEGFIKRYSLEDKPVSCVTDPNKEAYDAAALLNSFWATMGPRSMRDFLMGFGRGHQAKKFQGDWLQHGGTLLIDGAGGVAYLHRNESLGGFAPAVDVVDAAMKLAARHGRLPIY